MDQKLKIESWLRYSSVWRNVLTRVLRWGEERADAYVEDLKKEMEARIDNPSEFGFFYDPPSSYLFRAAVDAHLHEQIMECKSDQANPSLIWQRLVRAIAGQLDERVMENESFDWDEARHRYERERRDIESWLAAQD